MITRAINSDRPRENLTALVNLISKEKDQFPIKDPITGRTFQEEDLKQGLRMLIIDEAIHHAGGLGLKFDATKFFNDWMNQLKALYRKITLILWILCLKKDL